MMYVRSQNREIVSVLQSIEYKNENGYPCVFVNGVYFGSYRSKDEAMVQIERVVANINDSVENVITLDEKEN